MQAALRSLEMTGIRVFLYRPCILRQLQRKSSISRLSTCADRLRCLPPRFPTLTGRSSNHKRIDFAEMAAEDMGSGASNTHPPMDFCSPISSTDAATPQHLTTEPVREPFTPRFVTSLRNIVYHTWITDHPTESAFRDARFYLFHSSRRSH